MPLSTAGSSKRPAEVRSTNAAVKPCPKRQSLDNSDGGPPKTRSVKRNTVSNSGLIAKSQTNKSTTQCKLLQVNDVLTVVVRFLPPWSQWVVATASRSWLVALCDVLGNPEPGMPPASPGFGCGVAATPFRSTDVSKIGRHLYLQHRQRCEEEWLRTCPHCASLVPIHSSAYQVLLRAYPAWRCYYVGARAKGEGRPPSLFFLPCDRCRNDPTLSSPTIAVALIKQLRSVLDDPSLRFGMEQEFRRSIDPKQWFAFDDNCNAHRGPNQLFGSKGVQVSFDGWTTAPQTQVPNGYTLPIPAFSKKQPVYLPSVAADSPGTILRFLAAALNGECKECCPSLHGGKKVPSSALPKSSSPPLTLLYHQRASTSKPYDLPMQSTMQSLVDVDVSGPKADSEGKLPTEGGGGLKDDDRCNGLASLEAIEFQCKEPNRERRLSPAEAHRSGYCYSWTSEIGRCRLGIVISLLRSLLCKAQQSKVQKVPSPSGVAELKRPTLIIQPDDPSWAMLLTQAVTFYEPPFCSTFASWTELSSELFQSEPLE